MSRRGQLTPEEVYGMASEMDARLLKDGDPFNGDDWAAMQVVRAYLAEHTARLLAEWHEDDGSALWWKFPVEEPPYCGSPLWDDWPDYHTHWTPIPLPVEPPR